MISPSVSLISSEAFNSSEETKIQCLFAFVKLIGDHGLGYHEQIGHLLLLI